MKWTYEKEVPWEKWESTWQHCGASWFPNKWGWFSQTLAGTEISISLKDKSVYNEVGLSLELTRTPPRVKQFFSWLKGRFIGTRCRKTVHDHFFPAGVPTKLNSQDQTGPQHMQTQSQWSMRWYFKWKASRHTQRLIHGNGAICNSGDLTHKCLRGWGWGNRVWVVFQGFLPTSKLLREL